uniref:Uncharacterized protein n=1 Tax=Anguilla anguilla TaxID=7936 RepID=A0A0E9VE62_ANGAN
MNQQPSFNTGSHGHR